MILELGRHELAVAQRHGRSLALMMIDLDRFKCLNDTNGHAAGDQILRALADTLRATLRSCDLLGHIGGEEFVVVLTETQAPEAQRTAERLRGVIEKLRTPWKGSELGCTVSIGVATLDRKDKSFDDLMEDADKALYRAKAAGRNQVNGPHEENLRAGAGRGLDALLP